MRNYLLLISLILSLTKLSGAIDVKDLNLYTYFIPSKKIIICSDKKEVKQDPVLNEFENGKGFTCLLDLKKSSFIKVTLYISEVEENYKNNYEIDVDVGQTPLFRGLDFPSIKYLYIKNDYKSNKIFFSDNNCDMKNIQTCIFKEMTDSLFIGKFLKMTFTTKEKVFPINLLEKSALVTSNDDCDPPCEFGICNDGDCLCQFGYMGVNCSVKLESKDFRFGIFMLLILTAASAALGAFIMLIIWWIINCLSGVDESADVSKEVDIMEQWESKNPQ